MNDLDIQHIRQTIKFVRDWTLSKAIPVGISALTFHADALLAEVERLQSEMRMRELHHFETEAALARAADYIGHVPSCADDDCLACDLRALLDGVAQ